MSKKKRGEERMKEEDKWGRRIPLKCLKGTLKT